MNHNRKVETAKIILTKAGGTVNADHSIDYNLQRFFNQFVRAGNIAVYRVGLDYLHFEETVILANTLNVAMRNFVQNKNMTFSNVKGASEIIGTVGRTISTDKFNDNPNPPKMVEGFFSQSGIVNIRFTDTQGQTVNWLNTGTNDFQMILQIEVEYDN